MTNIYIINNLITKQYVGKTILSDACQYFNKPTNAGTLKECVDSFNRNGKRCKF